MRTSFLAVASSLALATAPLAAQQYSFEGTVSYQMQNDATMQYSSGLGMLRLDIGAERGSVTTIIDPAKHSLTIMMSGQKMYMVREMPEMKAGMDSSTKLTNTGKTEVIAGVKCELWHGESKEGNFDVCASRDMGSFFAGMGGRKEPPAWAKQLKGNFFPLRVVNDKGETVMLATKVEKKKFDKAFFAVPSDYIKMEMPAGMGGAPPQD